MMNHAVKEIIYKEKSHQFIDSIIENGSTIYILHDDNGNEIFVNPRDVKFKKWEPIPMSSLMPTQVPMDDAANFKEVVLHVINECGNAYVIFDNIDKLYLVSKMNQINWTEDKNKADVFNHDTAKVNMSILEGVIGKLSVDMIEITEDDLS